MQSAIAALEEFKEKRMKTRIISGAILVVIAAAVLTLNSFFSITAVILVALLSVCAVYEILNNTSLVTAKPLVVLACVFALVMPLIFNFGIIKVDLAILIYIVFLILFSLKLHAKINALQFCATAVFPVILSYAFFSLVKIINHSSGHGLFLLLLILNFSSISDCGAYFVGSAIGKHKLAPVLSPKKTIEGVFGGIVSSIIVSVIMVVAFNKANAEHIDMLKILLITPVFSIIGMIGDIFASFIKRSCGIKDYSNLIPGHGGIMDRFDSILLIAPVFAATILDHIF